MSRESPQRGYRSNHGPNLVKCARIKREIFHETVLAFRGRNASLDDVERAAQEWFRAEEQAKAAGGEQ